MDYRDLMNSAPKGAVTIIDLEAERKKERVRLAQELGKKEEELTSEEIKKSNYISALDDPCDAFHD